MPAHPTAAELPDDHHYVVISSDSHAGADIPDYKPYLEKRWHDDFDVWAANYTNPWDFVDPRLERSDFDFGKFPRNKLPKKCFRRRRS